MKLTLICVFALAALAQGGFLDSLNLGDAINVVKTELAHLKEVAQLIWDGKSPQDIIKSMTTRHPTIKDAASIVCSVKTLQKIEYVQQACKFFADHAEEIPQPAPQTRVITAPSPVGDAINSVKKELEHFKEVAQMIWAGKSAEEIIKTITQRHATIKQAVDKLCGVKVFHKIDYVDEACKFFDANADQLNAATQPQTRRFVAPSPVGDAINTIKKELDHFKEVAQLIADGKSTEEIIKTITQRHAAIKDAVNKLCSVQVFHKIEYVDTACKFFSEHKGELEAATPVQTRVITAPSPVGDAINTIKQELAHFKEVANMIWSGKSAEEIIQTITKRHATIKESVNKLCSIQVFHRIDYVDTACKFFSENADKLNAAA